MPRFPNGCRWPFRLRRRGVGGSFRGTSRCAAPAPHRAPAPASEPRGWPPRSRRCDCGGSSEDLLVVIDARAPAGVLQPLLHLLIGSLTGERLLDAFAIVVERWRFPGMGLFESRAQVFVEILAEVLVADLDAGPEARVDE